MYLNAQNLGEVFQWQVRYQVSNSDRIVQRKVLMLPDIFLIISCSKGEKIFPRILFQRIYSRYMYNPILAALLVSLGL